MRIYKYVEVNLGLIKYQIDKIKIKIEGEVILQVLALGSLFFNQVVMNFVVQYTSSNAFLIAVNVVNCWLLFTYVFQCLRIENSSIMNEWNHFLQTNLYFLSNYVMAAFVLYIYIEAYLLVQESDPHGSYQALFTSFCQFSTIPSLLQGIRDCKDLKITPVVYQCKSSKLQLAELSMIAAITKTIMEYLRPLQTR